MLRAAAELERRRYPRAQLTLAARLRWPRPFSTLVELTETLDVSREGIQAMSAEPCQPGARVWVTVPFAEDGADPQPETPARVARVRDHASGGCSIGIHFELAEPMRWLNSSERRAAARFPIALPVRVRATGTPWPEETMTANVAENGLLIETSRQYAAGDLLQISLAYSGWAKQREVPARVVRTETLPGTLEQRIAVARLSAGKPGGKQAARRGSVRLT